MTGDQDLRTGADVIHVLVVGLVCAAQARQGLRANANPEGPYTLLLWN